jgi:hypothetical protein
LESTWEAEVRQHRRLLEHDLQGAGVVAAGFIMPAELIERGSLHRQNSPVGIIGRMGAVENVERLLEIAVIGERPAEAGKQRPVAGMGDGGLFKYGNSLGALSGGAERLTIGPRGVGILGIGTVALAADLHPVPRIGIGAWPGSALDVIDPVMPDTVWQPPRLAAKTAVIAADARSRASPDCLTHVNSRYQAN